MRLADLSLQELQRQAAGGGIGFRAGPFRIRLQTRLRPLLDTLRLLYAHTELEAPTGFHDFHIQLTRPAGLRRWWRPQAVYRIDGATPFEPYPLDHAYPLMEWGLNYSIATRAHQYCMLHAAVVERDGRALILPAMPGSGKSTLCAALIHRGWRLLSDEFGLVRPETGRLHPLPRVIPLKNESIQVIRRFAPDALLGPVYPDTRKGTVVHLAPPVDSIERQDETATPAWIVYPRYTADAEPVLEPEMKSQAFIRLANNSFNYQLLGETGFRTLTGMVRATHCLSFRYSDLEAAVSAIDRTCR